MMSSPVLPTTKSILETRRAHRAIRTASAEGKRIAAHSALVKADRRNPHQCRLSVGPSIEYGLHASCGASQEVRVRLRRPKMRGAFLQQWASSAGLDGCSKLRCAKPSLRYMRRRPALHLLFSHARRSRARTPCLGRHRPDPGRVRDFADSYCARRVDVHRVRLFVGGMGERERPYRPEKFRVAAHAAVRCLCARVVAAHRVLFGDAPRRRRRGSLGLGDDAPKGA